MNAFRTAIVCVFLLAAGMNLNGQTKEEKPAADPVNVLVDGLAFTRPAGWKWLPNTDASSAAAHFVILNQKAENVADVRFYLSERPPEETKATWKGFFEKDSQSEGHQERTGKYYVDWFSITGTHKSKDKSRTTTKFAGVIIPLEKRYVLARLFGPKNEVDAAMADFQKMIQSGLAED